MATRKAARTASYLKALRGRLCYRRATPRPGTRSFWRLADGPLGCAEKRRVEGCLAGGVEVVGLTEVDLIRRHQADACVV